MNLKHLSLTTVIALFSAFVSVAAYDHIQHKGNTEQNDNYGHLSRYTIPPTPEPSPSHGGGGVDFTEAAARSMETVVHVKTKYNPQPQAKGGRRDPMYDMFGEDFYRLFGDPRGMQAQPQEAAGSGVIVDANGYIITNNHVIEDADDIEVTLHNNKKYKAKVIGADKDFDIALIKIEESSLPTVTFGNSDSVKVGEWVLAVGNPFNLTSTVTAGIVSAKGRNINILEGSGGQGSNTAIESFIQTDAAVNPGNSGGALVNTSGELIGINTAIASTTGAYAGYSFAVPSNLVYKVFNDLKTYGMVQRGYLGVNIRSVDDALAHQLNLPSPEGVYVDNVIKGSAGESAGLKEKDVITVINGVKVRTAPELQEQVGRYRPGDKINVEYIRSGKVENTVVILKNKFNSTGLVNDSKEVLNILGADFETVNKTDAAKMGIDGGVRVKNVREGKFKQYTEIANGFVITFMNDQPIRSTDDIVAAITNKKGNITVEGVYPGKTVGYLYAFKM
jgi:serine protease Do